MSDTPNLKKNRADDTDFKVRGHDKQPNYFSESVLSTPYIRLFVGI